jgi:hypothetical protein
MKDSSAGLILTLRDSSKGMIVDTKKKNGIRWVPLAIYFSLLFAVDLVIVPVANYSLLPSLWDWPAFFFISFIMSQAGVMCVIGGLLSRAWPKGFLIASLISVVYCVAFFLSTIVFEPGSSDAISLGLWIVPALLLAGSGPMLLYRAFYGCSLTSGDKGEPFRAPVNVGSLFAITMVIASVAALASTPVRAWGLTSNQDYGVTFLSYVLLAPLATGIGVLPVTVCFFAGRDFGARLKRLCFFAALSAFATLAVWGVFYYFAASRLVDLPMWLFVSICSATFFSIGLLAIHAGGTRLVYRQYVNSNAPATKEDMNPFLDSVLTYSARTSDPVRTQSRYALGIILLVVCTANASMLVIQTRHATVTKKHEQLQSEFAKRNGSIQVVDGKITAAKLAPNDSDAVLRGLQGAQTIRALSLANSQVTSDAIQQIQRFPNLEAIDLSNTCFADESLADIKTPNFKLKVSLAGTKVTASGVRGWLSTAKPRSIDLSDLQLRNEDISGMQINAITEVKLKNNLITDEVFNSIAELRCVDVSDTKIDGSGLAKLACVEKLVLDGTNVSDATLIPFLKQVNTLNRLSIERTQVSSALFPALGTLQELRLGEGPITDDELAAFDLPVIELALHSRQFTGRGFQKKQSYIRKLDLSGSGIDDEGLINLANLQVLRGLDLSDTSVTDEGLKHLAKLQASELNLSNTLVTAAGLLRSDIVRKTVTVAPNQFTPEQIVELRGKMMLIIGSDFSVD